MMARVVWFLVGIAVAGVAGVALLAWRGRDSQSPPPLPVTAVAAEPAPAAPWNPNDVEAAARLLPRLHSLVVSRRGEVIFEGYYNGRQRDRVANVKSASKSIISALVGIAIERRLIPGVETPIVTYFPELATAPDPRKRTITVGNLLEMRSGLDGTSGRNYGPWVTSRNWVQHALARPMMEAPDEEMEYSTGNTHLLSAVLTKATGKSTLAFANEALGKPLGFMFAPWPRDPQGIYFGGNDMLVTPRQLLAIGELYLNRGRANGQQVVPEAWVARSCEGRTRNRRPGNPAFDPVRGFDPLRDRQYGYGWWVHTIGEFDTCFAWGYGGQYAWVVPTLDLVIVTTASPDVSEDRRDHRRALFDIVDERIVAPLGNVR